MDKNEPHKPKPGPSEDRLKIEGDWEQAVGKAMQKKRPKDGWPKPEPKKKRD